MEGLQAQGEHVEQVGLRAPCGGRAGLGGGEREDITAGKLLMK